MDLSSFIRESVKSLVVEGVRSRDIEKAIKLMSSYLHKRKIYTIPVVHEMTIEGKSRLGVYVFNANDEGALFVWELATSAQVETVMFTKNFNEAFNAAYNNGTTKFEVLVQSKGANTVQMLKLVESVLTGKTAMTDAAIRAQIKDAQLFESRIYTEAQLDQINEEKDPHIAELERKRFNINQRIRNAIKKGQDTTELEKEKAQIAAALADARISVRGGVVVQSNTNSDIDSYQEMFEEEERAAPEERFNDMKNYIYNVITGIRPLALLCGAPGVGKTFRVKQALTGTGKEKDRDWFLMKGKCTPTALYTALHDWKDQGKLIVFDDCDSVFKDPDAINLLKAAYDSDDERWVSWNTSSAIPMPEDLALACDDAVYNESKSRWEYPKQFLYEGGGILITNYSAGQIDTAIRNRALICNLDFTPNEILDLIRGLAPKIMPDILTPAAKEEAIDYLQSLVDKNAPVDLSIRSFTLCAGIMGSDADDRSKKRMIQEQMKLQSLRGGKKY